MVAKNEVFAMALKQAGHSVTSSRKAVFDAVCKEHPTTMAKLTRTLTNTTDRASVYRSIALFEELGIIQRIHIGWKYQLELSDRFSHHHHHITCHRCAEVISLPHDEQIEKNLQVLAKSVGYRLRDHQFEMVGLCTKCQALL